MKRWVRPERLLKKLVMSASGEQKMSGKAAVISISSSLLRQIPKSRFFGEFA